MRQFSLSANIEEGFAQKAQYIVTPNARQVAEGIVKGFHSGVHSFTIIGSYGTGKSSFLLALERDLVGKKRKELLSPSVLSKEKEFEVWKIVGDYRELSSLLAQKLSVEGTTENIFDALRSEYHRLRSEGKFLVIMIDEFGKVLEHAAKNSPERELYFIQKFAEFVNVPTRSILLLTTLHQNFSAYARKLTDVQKEEWTKVKGRFQELVFVEPVEQLLYLASARTTLGRKRKGDNSLVSALVSLARKTGFVSHGFSEDTAQVLAPLEPFAAYVITQAIQRYGQNERSLFSFLNARGASSLSEYRGKVYHLQCCYDYIYYSFYSYLKEANADSMQWSSMQVAIERVEGLSWDTPTDMAEAIKLVKTIGLLNLFGNASFKMSREETAQYAQDALGIEAPLALLGRLEQYKIIRYAGYKFRYILFDGTDINIEDEIRKAGLVVSRPVNCVDGIRNYCFKKVAPVKACYLEKGTPRYFEYEVLSEGVDKTPVGDTDGYIQLIFSSDKGVQEATRALSERCGNAIVYACFGNTEELVNHLYQIEKYRYILDKVLIDKSDKVAINEINHLMEYEKVVLNKSIRESLFAYDGQVTWIFKGEERTIHSLRDFNRLLSLACNTIYPQTPRMINELFNKHKLSSSISSARGKYLAALLNQSNKPDLGFPQDKFPPEKTIYYSLLKNTGLHANGEFADEPTDADFMPLWEACEEFLSSTVGKARKVSDLIKKLLSKPYKLKQGFLDFWIPTYLYIKRQDYSLYGANGAYIPNITMEFFELLQKRPGEYWVKAFDVTGVKVQIFNQYRKFLNVEAMGSIKSDDFIETIKPFFFFYNRRLNDYAKHTRKFNHEQTVRFRDTLARAKDPEKTFFEDLPEALGYNREALLDSAKVQEFCYVINRAVKELRSCYSDLIDRVEDRLLDTLGIESRDYSEYIVEIRHRLASVKEYLLTDRLKEFHQHAMAEFDNRNEWYQSICYTALEQPLERLRDEQEERLTDNLTMLFRECEKYSDISKMWESESDEIYSLDLVSTYGSNIYAQTFRLPESERKKSARLEADITRLLDGMDNDNISVCTLLKILNKRLGSQPQTEQKK